MDFLSVLFIYLVASVLVACVFGQCAYFGDQS